MGLARRSVPGAPFFDRTHGGQAVDLLLRLRGKLIAIEVKLGLAAPELRGREVCTGDLGVERGDVVDRGAESVRLRPHVWMGGPEALLDHLRIRPATPAATAPTRTRSRRSRIRATSPTLVATEPQAHR